MTQKSEWFDTFFEDYRPVFDSFPAKRTNEVVRFLTRHLNLKPGRHLLDCPAGIGRVAIPLAKRGIKITAVDIQQDYLDELDNKARRLALPITTVQRDMRRIDFDREFDAVINLHTSFGYFRREADNFRVLKNFHRALKPGGKLALELINRDYLVAHFRPREWFEAKGVVVLTENTFDFRTSAVTGQWHFLRGGQKATHDIHIRAYSFHELAALFKKAGFVDIAGYGSPKDEPISQDCRWLHMVASRPK